MSDKTSTDHLYDQNEEFHDRRHRDAARFSGRAASLCDYAREAVDGWSDTPDPKTEPVAHAILVAAVMRDARAMMGATHDRHGRKVARVRR